MGYDMAIISFMKKTHVDCQNQFSALAMAIGELVADMVLWFILVVQIVLVS